MSRRGRGRGRGRDRKREKREESSLICRRLCLESLRGKATVRERESSREREMIPLPVRGVTMDMATALALGRRGLLGLGLLLLRLFTRDTPLLLLLLTIAPWAPFGRQTSERDRKILLCCSVPDDVLPLPSYQELEEETESLLRSHHDNLITLIQFL
jgi:hypothetical protein